jgi:hypothetical protein
MDSTTRRVVSFVSFVFLRLRPQADQYGLPSTEQVVSRRLRWDTCLLVHLISPRYYPRSTPVARALRSSSSVTASNSPKPKSVQW